MGYKSFMADSTKSKIPREEDSKKEAMTEPPPSTVHLSTFTNYSKLPIELRIKVVSI
jgi:hypothetical protein